LELGRADVAYCGAQGGAKQYLTQQMLEKSGFLVRQQIVWVKPMAPLSRSAYHWRHEPCWYAVRKGQTARWAGGRAETTVWEVASPLHLMSGSDEESTVHPTQKPLECMARPIRNHGAEGDVVYDPFLGSGTTLVAAHRLGRRCFGAEIEPKYVEVALRRAEAEGLSCERDVR
jgi:DNA modification methylase